MSEKKQTETDGKSVYHIGREIASSLAGLRAEHSFSFILNEEGHVALKELIDLSDDKIPKNMTRIKESIDEVFGSLSDKEPGTPLNVNLSEDDIKAMEKVLELVDRNWEIEE